ncbi:DUF4199 domain-containing protein [Gramella sp. MT6]|uniref:DUF4199 domain-containing protein n=1 Tax=Gramella sp. MT6 TaxID=2705471 RepID=UPI001C5D3CDD|nr:DUF4199 domain-containing protein [Gramella sp. MT6]QYA26807.1 DUF4199 domain-containing protein [Gramella sp. MT6]
MDNSPSIKSIAYTYGLLLAAYSVLVLVLIYAFNISQDNWIIGVVNILVTIAILALAINNYKSKNNNYLSIKEALKVGLATAAVGGLVAAIYAYIHYSFVYPEFIEMVKETSYQNMSDQGMSDKQISDTMKMTEFTMKPWFFSTMTLVSSLFFGLLISLITGAILKKQDPALG